MLMKCLSESFSYFVINDPTCVNCKQSIVILTYFGYLMLLHMHNTYMLYTHATQGNIPSFFSRSGRVGETHDQNQHVQANCKPNHNFFFFLGGGGGGGGGGQLLHPLAIGGGRELGLDQLIQFSAIAIGHFTSQGEHQKVVSGSCFLLCTLLDFCSAKFSCNVASAWGGNSMVACVQVYGKVAWHMAKALESWLLVPEPTLVEL